MVRQRLVVSSLLAFVLFGVAAIVTAQSEHQASPVTYEVSTDQQTLLPLEPVFLTFSLTNRTASAVPARFDISLERTAIAVRGPGGGVVESDRLSMASAGMWDGLRNSVLEPGGGRTTRERLMINLDSFFPTAGTYRVTFKVLDRLSQAPLSSNLVLIRIVEPEGIDREAYDYLRQWPHAGSWFQTATQSELEDFLTRFPDSGYSDLARVALGEWVFAELEYQRASEIFSVVAQKGRSRLSEHAAERLQLIREAARAARR